MIGYQEFLNESVEALDKEIQSAIIQHLPDDSRQLREILEYHFSFDTGSTSARKGKRIRPVIVMLTSRATSSGYQEALPVAAAIEMIHNFSLIHDDIEDNSPKRRGRLTLWKKYGMASAINAGDALLALAFVNLQKLDKVFPPEKLLNIYSTLFNSVLSLTKGQHLDIVYEEAKDVTLEAYMMMTHGKTCSLLRDSFVLGAICGDSSSKQVEAFEKLGNTLGMGFQIQDDYLGIWGDEGTIGKSAHSDLTEGKKTYPIITGIQLNGRFAQAYPGGRVDENGFESARRMLEQDGIKQLTEQQINHYNFKALGLVNNLTVGETYKAVYTELIANLIPSRG